MKFNQANSFKLYLLLLLILLTITWLQPAIPLIFLFRDTFHLTGVSPYYGLFSNLGSFLLCATASITLFSAILLYSLKKDKEFKDREFIMFLSTFGLISLFLMLDDFFMFHEYLAPVALGISEKAVIAIIGVVTVSGLVRFRKIILKTKFKILMIGLFFLLLSVLFDKIFNGHEDWVYLFKVGEKYILEDGAKFLGIATWLYYFTVSSFNQIMNTFLEAVSEKMVA
jgi:hypothetical protein